MRWAALALALLLPSLAQDDLSLFRLVQIHNRWTSDTHLTVIVKTSAHFAWFDSLDHWYKPDSVEVFLQVSPWPDGPYSLYKSSGVRLMGAHGQGEFILLTAGPLRKGTVYWYYVAARAWNPSRELVDSTDKAAVVIGTSRRKDVEAWQEDLRKRVDPIPGDQFQAPPEEPVRDSLLLLK